MEVNNAVLKLIIKECCRSLSYDDEERQFSFSLRPSLHRVWERKKNDIWSIQRDFVLDDFNMVLSDIESSTEIYSALHLTSLKDKDLVNGEVLSIGTFGVDIPTIIVRMKPGQYLNISTGKGISFGDRFDFGIGREVVTSEGYNIGVCKVLAILRPTVLSIALSRVFLGRYYLNNIGSSLWPIYDEAIEYLRCYDPIRLGKILNICEDLGVGSFALLNILKGVCATTR